MTYRDRVKPKAGFTLAPFNVAKSTVYLRRDPAGFLTYRAEYWEATEGRERLLTECTLPPARSEDWRAVGLEPPD